MNALFESIKNNDLPRFKLLLVSNSEHLLSLDDSGITPLIYAVLLKNKIFAELLIIFGADINRRDYKGRCAIHYACENEDTELVDLLINNGALCEIADKEGHTPLAISLSKFGEDSSTTQILMKKMNEQKEELPTFIWCLVGNIVENRYYGENREVRRGTKKFTPNTKVYCFPPLWGDGYEEIQVIGKLRNRKNLGVIITSSKHITNWRLQKVFQPFVVKTMIERKGWDATEESKSTIENMLVWLPSRTIAANLD